MRLVRYCILFGEFRSDWRNAYGLERIMLQADVQIGPYFRCCLAPKSLHKASPGSKYLVRGDPQTEPFNEEPRWHVPDYCARERCRLDD